ncbi:universal stress protein [Chloroflexota bacterium]
MDCNKILVPIRGAVADEEAITLACQLAKKSKGTVYAAHIIQVKRALPLDAAIESEIKRGEEILKRAELVAGGQGCMIETDLLQARDVGTAIIEEAKERGVNLVLIGLDYYRRFGEATLGDVVPYVLKNAPCRVIVCREPMAEGETQEFKGNG